MDYFCTTLVSFFNLETLDPIDFHCIALTKRLTHFFFFIYIKLIVPVLDSDWLSCVRSCCKLLYKHTHLFTSVCCSATNLLQP